MNSGSCSAAAWLGLREGTENRTTLLFSRLGERSQYMFFMALCKSSVYVKGMRNGIAKWWNPRGLCLGMPGRDLSIAIGKGADIRSESDPRTRRDACLIWPAIQILSRAFLILTGVGVAPGKLSLLKCKRARDHSHRSPASRNLESLRWFILL